LKQKERSVKATSSGDSHILYIYTYIYIYIYAYIYTLGGFVISIFCSFIIFILFVLTLI
jgi:hypothetical protein